MRRSAGRKAIGTVDSETTSSGARMHGLTWWGEQGHTQAAPSMARRCAERAMETRLMTATLVLACNPGALIALVQVCSTYMHADCQHQNVLLQAQRTIDPRDAPLPGMWGARELQTPLTCLLQMPPAMPRGKAAVPPPHPVIGTARAAGTSDSRSTREETPCGT